MSRPERCSGAPPEALEDPQPIQSVSIVFSTHTVLTIKQGISTNTSALLSTLLTRTQPVHVHESCILYLRL